jgi:predicted permease
VARCGRVQILSELFAIVGPVYLIVGLGYAWVRSGRAFPSESLTELIMLVGAPCLVFSHLAELRVSGEAMALMFRATLLALVCFSLLGWVALRVAGLPIRAFLGTLVFANTANMGLPVCLLAFGEEGLTLAVCYYAVVATGQFTFGVFLYSGRLTLAELRRAPLPFVVLLALLLNAAEVSVPAWIANTTDILGDLVIPLMQLMLGVSLAELRPSGLARSLGLALGRIGMGLAVGVALADLLGLEGIVRGVFIVDSAMPAAVFNFLFARRYDQRPAEVASVVMFSTLLAFATLPVILAFVL